MEQKQVTVVLLFALIAFSGYHPSAFFSLLAPPRSHETWKCSECLNSPTSPYYAADLRAEHSPPVRNCVRHSCVALSLVVER